MLIIIRLMFYIIAILRKSGQFRAAQKKNMYKRPSCIDKQISITRNHT